MRQRPQRVLMVTVEWPRASWGGTAHFIVRQAEFLRRAGVHVDVHHFVGGRSPRNYAGAWFAVHRRLRQERYDVVHAQFGQSALPALPCPVPLVVTLRGDDLQGILHDTQGHLTTFGRLLPLVSKFTAKRADAVIVVSDHMRAFLPPTIEPQVIPSGLNLELFRPMPQAEARRAAGLADGKKYVLFVGQPDLARKRFALAQEAVARVAQRHPVELVVGWRVPHDRIPVLMNACDALVFTSLQEGSPNAVKEALACDLPVVSVRVGDVPERLQDVAGCELCADDRPETIAAALERVLCRGGRAAGHAAVAHLDERRQAQRVIEVYRRAIARHGRAPTNGKKGGA